MAIKKPLGHWCSWLQLAEMENATHTHARIHICIGNAYGQGYRGLMTLQRCSPPPI